MKLFRVIAIFFCLFQCLPVCAQAPHVGWGQPFTPMWFLGWAVSIGLFILGVVIVLGPILIRGRGSETYSIIRGGDKTMTILIGIILVGTAVVLALFYGSDAHTRFSPGFAAVIRFLGPALYMIGAAAAIFYAIGFRSKQAPGERAGSGIIWGAVGVAVIALLPLLADWYLDHNAVKRPSRFQNLESGTAYDEKTHALDSQTWRFHVVLPEAPTKISQAEFPPLGEISHVGSYQSKELVYLVGPRTAPYWRDRPEFKEAGFMQKLAKDECASIVSALHGKETNGHPISLDNGKYVGYSSEGSAQWERNYRVMVFVDDQSYPDKVSLFYVIARGKWDNVQSTQTNQLFDSFKILPPTAEAKI